MAGQVAALEAAQQRRPGAVRSRQEDRGDQARIRHLLPRLDEKRGEDQASEDKKDLVHARILPK
jgi:hypothetical protein